MIKEEYKKLAKRFDGVFADIGLEHCQILEPNSELYQQRKYYSIEDGITLLWMLGEAEYWLSCYYKNGNCRCDDRFIDEECYKIWRSETGKLKRLIAAIEKYENLNVCIEA